MSKGSKRIGILGGTFDPIHIGHLAMAKMAQDQMRLDQVIFVPSFLPPHKSSGQIVAANDRLKMVRLAIKGARGFSVSDFEVKKTGKSYSVDTLRHFKKVFPKGTKLFFIVGEDAYTGLKNWRKIEEILNIVEFIVVNRPGPFEKTGRVHCHHVVMPGIDISSSYIRQRIGQKKEVKYFVPEDVFRYINKNKLYRH